MSLYSYIVEMETNFDDDKARRYFVNHWTDSLWYSLLYLIIVFSGQAWMKSRKKYELRPVLIAWNFILGLFSFVGFVRLFPEILASTNLTGILNNLCSIVASKGALGFWTYMLSISKLYEFGDTMFIVLRKQKLIFLHWYHHVATCIFTWYSYSHRMGYAVYVTWMNLGVHALMYTYYAFKAMRYPIPRAISMFITTLQIIQMFIGYSLIYMGYAELQHDSACFLKEEAAIAGILMYVSYFILFGHFFYKTYLSRTEHLKQK